MLTHGSVFTGIGLLDYGLCLAGLGEPAWVCERDEWRRESILARRFPGAVRYDDVRGVGADCEPVELLAGGFPCKGASTLGKLEGFGHPETVLWREMARAIGELRPRYVLVENVANLLALHDGAVWGEVLGDLVALGFNVVWDCLPAAAVGAPHGRDRVLAVATYADGPRAHAHASSGASRPAVGERAGAAADSDRVAGATELARNGRLAALVEPGQVERAQRLHGAPEAAADVHERVVPAGRNGERADCLQAHPRSVAVEWGEYGPAVDRWERVLGRPAPEPLLRGVDARVPRRVERSRLSALGDGVQVQVGQLAGLYILQLERERLAPPLG